MKVTAKCICRAGPGADTRAAAAPSLQRRARCGAAGAGCSPATRVPLMSRISCNSVWVLTALPALASLRQTPSRLAASPRPPACAAAMRKTSARPASCRHCRTLRALPLAAPPLRPSVCAPATRKTSAPAASRVCRALRAPPLAAPLLRTGLCKWPPGRSNAPRCRFCRQSQ